MNWVKESGEELPEDESGEPELAALDELQTYQYCSVSWQGFFSPPKIPQ